MSSSIFEAYAREHLAEYVEPFLGLVRAGNDSGARDLIIQIQMENPLASAFIKSLFSGTPAQVVEGFAAWWPDVRDIPGVEKFAAALQRRLRVEWERPRDFLPPRRKG